MPGILTSLLGVGLLYYYGVWWCVIKTRFARILYARLWCSLLCGFVPCCTIRGQTGPHNFMWSHFKGLFVLFQFQLEFPQMAWGLFDSSALTLWRSRNLTTGRVFLLNTMAPILTWQVFAFRSVNSHSNVNDAKLFCSYCSQILRSLGRAIVWNEMSQKTLIPFQGERNEPIFAGRLFFKVEFGTQALYILD